MRRTSSWITSLTGSGPMLHAPVFRAMLTLAALALCFGSLSAAAAVLTAGDRSSVDSCGEAPIHTYDVEPFGTAAGGVFHPRDVLLDAENRGRWFRDGSTSPYSANRDLSIAFNGIVSETLSRLLAVRELIGLVRTCLLYPGGCLP